MFGRCARSDEQKGQGSRLNHFGRSSDHALNALFEGWVIFAPFLLLMACKQKKCSAIGERMCYILVF